MENEEKEEQNEQKISLPETIVLMLYIVPLDIVGAILLFFGLDDFFILDLLTFPVTQFYFRMKGVRSTYDLVASGLELIPYIGALPLKTIGVTMTIWTANHPKALPSKAITAAAKIPAAKIPATK